MSLAVELSPNLLREFQKINYSFSRIIIILEVWGGGVDGCPLLPDFVVELIL
jgi:hypothetical protein